MDAFFRGLALFIFGVFVGSAGILFFTPSFNVVVSRHPGALKLIELTDSPEPPAAPVVSSAASAPVVASKALETPSPAKLSVVSAPVPVTSAAPANAVATVEPAIDFKAIAEHLILWPTSVTVKTPTAVPVLVDGKKVQDLVLEVGTVLQVSKVLADGSLEARAKGAKFEIKSSLTDFSSELGKRVSELVAKGTKFDSSFPATLAAPASSIPAAAPAAVAPVVAAAVPKAPLTLAQRVDLLYGIKPEPAAAPAAIVPPTPTVTAVEAAPAPVAEQKGVEKGKDLDRKMNQLFK
jgi:hypothetical protein